MRNLKKITFVAVLTALALMVAQPAKAQFGIKAGTYATQLSDLNNYKVKNNVGFVGGIVYKQNLILGFTVQPELLYVAKNSSLQGTADNANIGKRKYDMRYLQLPVSVQYGFNLVVIRPFVQVVPYLNYAISKSLAGETSWDDLNRFTYGVGLGGGVDLWKLQFSLRYNWDLSKVGKHASSPNDSYSQYRHSKSRGLEVSLAYIF